MATCLLGLLQGWLRVSLLEFLDALMPINLDLELPF